MKQFYHLFIYILSGLFFLAFAFPQNLEAQNAPFILMGKVVLNGKPIGGASIELLQNGELLQRTITPKNGKYSFEMDQDTENQNNEYTIYVTKEFTVPKTLVVNTYIPKADYDENPFEYLLQITLIPTTLKDIVLRRPSAKIKWIPSSKSFDIDQNYAKIVKKEEDALAKNPDKYLGELAARERKLIESKQAKAKEDDKKNEQAAALAKQKADSIAEIAEQQRLSLLKQEELLKQAKIKAELLKQEKIKAELLKKEQAKEELARQAASKEPQPALAVKEELSPTINADSLNLPPLPLLFDFKTNFLLKRNRAELIREKENAQRKKNGNMGIKLETNNVMSSLLDAVDLNDKKQMPND